MSQKTQRLKARMLQQRKRAREAKRAEEVANKEAAELASEFRELNPTLERMSRDTLILCWIVAIAMIACVLAVAVLLIVTW